MHEKIKCVSRWKTHCPSESLDGILKHLHIASRAACSLTAAVRAAAGKHQKGDASSRDGQTQFTRSMVLLLWLQLVNVTDHLHKRASS